VSTEPREHPNHGNELQGALCLLIAVVCFASVPLFLRYIAVNIEELDAWTVNAVRYGVATVFWLPFVIQRLWRVPAERRVLRDAIGASLVNTVGQIGWAVAAYHSEAGVIAFVIRSSFFFAIVYSVILLPQERATVRRSRFWLGGLGVVAGVVTFMSGNAFTEGKSSPLGLVIILLTAAAWGMYGVLVKRDLGRYDARVGFAVNSLYTTIILIVAMFLFGDWRVLGTLPGEVWLLLIGSAFAGITFSHVLLYRGIHALGPVISSGASCVQPFLTALGAWIFLDEVLRTRQWVGGCILVGSCVILLSLRFGRQPDSPPTHPKLPQEENG